MHCFIGAEDPFLGYDKPIDAADSELLGTAPLQQNDNQLPFPQIPDGEQLVPTASSTPQPIFIQVAAPMSQPPCGPNRRRHHTTRQIGG